MTLNNEMFDAVLEWLETPRPDAPQLDMHHSVRECGSVCCIAGFVALQVDRDYIREAVPHWPRIQHMALKGLGLPESPRLHTIPLFDPDLAPENCTPDEAAAAVRDFRENWNGVVEYNPW